MPSSLPVTVPPPRVTTSSSTTSTSSTTDLNLTMTNRYECITPRRYGRASRCVRRPLYSNACHWHWQWTVAIVTVTYYYSIDTTTTSTSSNLSLNCQCQWALAATQAAAGHLLAWGLRLRRCEGLSVTVCVPNLAPYTLPVAVENKTAATTGEDGRPGRQA